MLYQAFTTRVEFFNIKQKKAGKSRVRCGVRKTNLAAKVTL